MLRRFPAYRNLMLTDMFTRRSLSDFWQQPASKLVLADLGIAPGNTRFTNISHKVDNLVSNRQPSLEVAETAW